MAKEADQKCNYEVDNMPLTVLVSDFEEILQFTTNLVLTAQDGPPPIYGVTKACHRRDEDLESEYYALEE